MVVVWVECSRDHTVASSITFSLGSKLCNVLCLFTRSVGVWVVVGGGGCKQCFEMQARNVRVRLMMSVKLFATKW